MTNIEVIVTCHNRCNYTKRAITGLVSGNPDCKFHFIVVDDASTDGTVEMLEQLSDEISITVINGDGNLFYSGGMRCGMLKAIVQKQDNVDYELLINDDVEFSEKCIEKLIAQSVLQDDSVIVGACSSDNGTLSYGGIQYTKGIKYRFLGVDAWRESADTFNANCVLIPRKVFVLTPVMDEHYKHSLGDFDYGLSISKSGYPIHSSKEYVGICNDNPIDGTWQDSSLSRIQRFRLKENFKGSPNKQWFYFLRKNFNFRTAVFKSITPYVRILIGK